MIDDSSKVWLIEVNTNPCLELSCNLLAKMIPQLIDNTLKICLDPLFPYLQNNRNKCLPGNGILGNKFELIFEEQIQGLNRDMKEMI